MIVRCDSANKQTQYKEPTCKKGNQFSVNIRMKKRIGKITDQCKQNATVSRRTGEGP